MRTGAKARARPFLATKLAVAGQGLWPALVRGQPCRPSPWNWLPLALALCAGVAEARAARHRGHGVVASIGWGLALGALTTFTAFVFGMIEAGEAGCFD